VLQFGTGFCFLRSVKTKRNSHEIQTQNEAAKSSQGKRAKMSRGPHNTSTRRTTNAMKSCFIPAIGCAKKSLTCAVPVSRTPDAGAVGLIKREENLFVV